MELPLTSFPLLVLLLALLPVLYGLLRLCRDPRKQPRADGLKPYPLLGTFPHLIRNQHRFLEWTTDVVKRCPTHTMSFKVPGLAGVAITANPANFEHIAKTNFANYPKGPYYRECFAELLGDGIFNADSDSWRAQRRAASAEMHSARFIQFSAATIASLVRGKLVPLLEALAERQAGLPAEHRPGRKRGREAAASEEAATFAGGSGRCS